MTLEKRIAMEKSVAVMVAVAMCGIFQQVQMMKVKMWIRLHVTVQLHLVLVSLEVVTKVM